ncbi:peptidase S26B, signal peptidase [Xylanimonas cellulosilytica DSM 15894]|uniref:Signal peptidase I n=1 Tax=Xylanimonas cellulosilytica (strain DSM 15894 / JCM 12276 / CECT 5975 / KCTC 9989 / LMG 20990 / NBRC 107835 / XIL07) TaxID=446471 RepID=D1BYH4_XYLCX|nr:signal peptidase I [Xylanimonas cellulosilytica]ACZ31846.1 peptidase S26B, signal peptidase [Xylanimonas cellulosilytica DSM 15894]
MAQPTPYPPHRPARHRPALGSVALTLLMVTLLGLLAAVMVAPRLVGAVPLAVPSNSMQPALAYGDLVMVQPVEPEQVRVGDVIVFRRESGAEVVTHRVVDIVEWEGEVVELQTQGDAAADRDAPITRDQLEGRVAYSVPLIGRLAQQPWLLALVVAVGVVLAGTTALALFAPRAREARALATSRVPASSVPASHTPASHTPVARVSAAPMPRCRRADVGEAR